MSMRWMYRWTVHITLSTGVPPLAVQVVIFKFREPWGTRIEHNLLIAVHTTFQLWDDSADSNMKLENKPRYKWAEKEQTELVKIWSSGLGHKTDSAERRKSLCSWWKKKSQIFPLCFQFSQNNTGLFFLVNLIMPQTSAHFRELDYSQAWFGSHIFQLAPISWVSALYYFFQICFWKLECQPTFQCKFFFSFSISDMATFQPFIQIVLEEPLDFQGIYLFIFIWYIFTKNLLHYSSWS